MNGFTNPLDPKNDTIKAAIRTWALSQLALPESATVDVLEHQCSEPNCVHAETVISVADTEGVRFFKINKPLVFIRKWDVKNWQEIKKE